jgi:hypothetical protein
MRIQKGPHVPLPVDQPSSKVCGALLNSHNKLIKCPMETKLLECRWKGTRPENDGGKEVCDTAFTGAVVVLAMCSADEYRPSTVTTQKSKPKRPCAVYVFIHCCNLLPQSLQAPRRLSVRANAYA